jgi:hemerythrin
MIHSGNRGGGKTVSLIAWNRSYSVNVRSCDAQHQQLFSVMNKLHEAMKAGKGRVVLAEIVDELDMYTKTHFRAEEALMERAQYPELNEHRAQHRYFVSQVAQFRKDLQADAGNAVAVLTFLKDWLANHIQQTDKMYSSHLNSSGIE